MKTILIFLCVLVTIAIGLYLKHEEIIFKPNKEDETLSYDNKVIQSRFNDTLSQLTRLTDILTGKWQLEAIENSPFERKLLTGKLEFKNSNEFLLYVNTRYYHKDYGLSSWNSNVGMVQGGSIVGNVVISESQFQLIIKECNITTTYEYDRHFTDYDNMTCELFKQRSFGNVKGINYELETKQISNDTIIIEGIDFSKSSDLEYTFIKIK